MWRNLYSQSTWTAALLKLKSALAKGPNGLPGSDPNEAGMLEAVQEIHKDTAFEGVMEINLILWALCFFLY